MTPATGGDGELAGRLRTLVARLNHALREPGTRRGITPTRLTAMAILEKRGPVRPGDLASRLNITAASMSRLTDALVEGGWAARDPDPDDRRAQLLRLTEQGHGALRELRAEGTGELADAIGDLDAQERAALEAALPVLLRLVEQLVEPRAS